MASSINTVSGNRVAGTASGMDTESIVEKCFPAHSPRSINRQVKTAAGMETGNGKGITTDINSFHDKYFSFYSSANTNLASNAFYNTMNAARAVPVSNKIDIRHTNAAGEGDHR